jgi:flagellar FliJ protein
MSWSHSLIRIATYEVETRQKQLAEIVTRCEAAEGRLAALQMEGELEAVRAEEDASAGWYLVGFHEGLRMRKAKVQAEIDALKLEQLGARDALAHAFEEQKKYEQVAEAARVLEVKEAGRREAAAMDEMGLRRAATR